MIELMERQERLLAKLYGGFARNFPDHADFWNGLAQEELRHAELIQKLDAASQKGVVLFNEGKIKARTLLIFI
jgi:hypothetical protein